MRIGLFEDAWLMLQAKRSAVLHSYMEAVRFKEVVGALAGAYGAMPPEAWRATPAGDSTEARLSHMPECSGHHAWRRRGPAEDAVSAVWRPVDPHHPARQAPQHEDQRRAVRPQGPLEEPPRVPPPGLRPDRAPLAPGVCHSALKEAGTHGAHEGLGAGGAVARSHATTAPARDREGPGA